MNLLGRNGICSMKILMDSSIKFNFLNPFVVQSARLRVHSESNLQVRVANGTKLVRKGKRDEVISI